ncbi:sugar isomerase domain-containing protein [Egicoccus sp. AB-alg2]|uniref:sugar isomerase domain-containing protein n=1 Tax=Egicoccus sp. AB-alg2 TaxID=3242693 RepID=UPI00359D5D26
MADAAAFGSRMREHLEAVEQANGAVLDRVAERLLAAIVTDRLVHVTGTGHSTALVLEAFYRAGGLACVNPITHPALDPLAGGQASTVLERSDRLAQVLLDRAAPQTGDIAFVYSNSGANPVPVLLAEGLRAAGVHVVAVSSRPQLAAAPQRAHAKLDTVTDVLIDTNTPVGDAAYEAGDQRTAALSSLTSIYLWNLLLARLADRAAAAGVRLPLWTSANTPGGDERNAALFATYRPRIRQL